MSRLAPPPHPATTPGPNRLPDTSTAAQAARRDRVFGLLIEHCFGMFDDAGDFTGPPSPDARHRMWYAMPLLSGEPQHVARANAMLRHYTSGAAEHGGHFWGAGITSILYHYPDRIEPDLKQDLLNALAEHLPHEIGQCYRGYNDNFPSMAAMGLVLGGEMLKRPDLVESGIDTLQSLRRLLERRGAISEYASPTYSGITLTCLAVIAGFAQHAEARQLALFGEQRVWLELAARYHPATASLAGPHSRAYMVDMVAHAHNAHAVFYKAFGDRVWINPTTCFPPHPEQALHGGQHLLQAGLAWLVLPTYHPPAGAAELAFNKPEPCLIQADTEHAAIQRNIWSNDRHPDTPFAECQAGESHLVTYIDRDFALGTSSRPFLDSHQHTAFHLVHRRPTGDPLTGIASLFTRYLVDNPTPNRHHHLNDAGRTVCLQHDATAMVLARPKPAWADPPVGKDPTATPVTSLKLSLLLTCFGTQPDELWIGRERCDGLIGSSDTPAPIFLADGELFVAIHPLTLDNLGRELAIKTDLVNGFLMLDLVNYQGPARPFGVQSLVSTRNGFVLHADRREHWPGFAAFREAHAAPAITDAWDPSDAMRLVRYEHDNLTLEMEVSPFSEGIKHRSINGRLVRPPMIDLPPLLPIQTLRDTGLPESLAARDRS